MRATSTSVVLGTVILVGTALAWPFAAHPTARAESGIREVIPSRDKARYEVWKDEFLSTEIGRREWQAYAQETRLLLTIATSTDNRYGAAIGHYEWNRSGQLTAATIT